jgi:hypothetical protein
MHADIGERKMSHFSAMTVVCSFRLPMQAAVEHNNTYSKMALS